VAIDQGVYTDTNKAFDLIIDAVCTFITFDGDELAAKVGNYSFLNIVMLGALVGVRLSPWIKIYSRRQFLKKHGNQFWSQI